MQTNTSGPETTTEKLLKWGIPLGAAALIFYFWGLIVPFVLATLESTVKTIIYGVLLFAFFMYVIPNYKFLIKKITSFFIKMDPLSFMDRYADILTVKLRNVRKGIVNLRAEKISLEKDKAEAEKLQEESIRFGKAAKKLGQNQQAGLHGSRAVGAKEDLILINADLAKVNLSLTFMEKLEENWDVSITAMKEFIERKRKQWKRAKKTAETLGQAEDFLRGDTDEAKIYNESVRVLEEQMSQKFAYIEDFERRAKPIMQGYDLKKAVREEEGMQMLDDHSLFLPDFNVIDLDSTDFKILDDPQPRQQGSSEPTKFKFLTETAKKTTIVLILILSSLFAISQAKPYASVGITSYEKVVSPGVELGLYTDKVWGAVAYSNTKGEHYGSVRVYLKTFSVGKVDNFVWSGLNMHLSKGHTLSAEPGTAFVFNLWDKFAPQLSLSLPLPADPFKPAFGIGLNYWIK